MALYLHFQLTSYLQILFTLCSSNTPWAPQLHPSPPSFPSLAAEQLFQKSFVHSFPSPAGSPAKPRITPDSPPGFFFISLFFLLGFFPWVTVFILEVSFTHIHLPLRTSDTNSSLMLQLPPNWDFYQTGSSRIVESLNDSLKMFSLLPNNENSLGNSPRSVKIETTYKNITNIKYMINVKQSLCLLYSLRIPTVLLLHLEVRKILIWPIWPVCYVFIMFL